MSQLFPMRKGYDEYGKDLYFPCRKSKNQLWKTICPSLKENSNMIRKYKIIPTTSKTKYYTVDVIGMYG